MKTMLKKSIRLLAGKVLNVLWPKYMKAGNEHSLQLVYKHLFLQKVLRLNAHVPWPVHPTSNVMAPEKIERGTRTPGLGISCHLDGRNGIKLGKNVWIGPRVSIISMNHDIYDYSKYVAGKPVVIGDNCWLAANAVILSEVELGPHTIVAAGAVVMKSYPEGNCILAGVPAKIVKNIGDYLS